MFVRGLLMHMALEPLSSKCIYSLFHINVELINVCYIVADLTNLMSLYQIFNKASENNTPLGMSFHTKINANYI